MFMYYSGQKVMTQVTNRLSSGHDKLLLHYGHLLSSVCSVTCCLHNEFCLRLIVFTCIGLISISQVNTFSPNC